MSLRIAFDLDGVLADMDAELARQAENILGESITRRPSEPRADAGATPHDDAENDSAENAGERAAGNDTPLPVRLQLTIRQQRRLWRHVETIENFWERLEEIEPGAIARLSTVARERRWEVIFLTKRPRSAGDTSQVQTQRWLDAKGFTHPSVYVVRGSRGLIAAALDLDVVVDDRPENCMDVLVDSKARSMLVWREDEAQLPAGAKRLGIEVVHTVDECLNILTSAGSAKEPRRMQRVKRLLGFKESAKR